METSTPIKEITKALVAFQAENIVLGRTQTAGIAGGKQWKYVTLDEMLAIVRPILSKHGLYLMRTLGPGQGITIMVAHTSGEFIRETFDATDVIALTMAAESGKGSKGASAAQALGMAITYTSRYGVAAILNLATDDDLDGALTVERYGQAEKPKQAQPKQAKKDRKPSRPELVKGCNKLGKQFYPEHWNDTEQGAKRTMASQASDGRTIDFNKLTTAELTKLHNHLSERVERYGDYLTQREADKMAAADGEELVEEY